MHPSRRTTSRAARREAERQLVSERLETVRGAAGRGWVPEPPAGGDPDETAGLGPGRDTWRARVVDRLPVTLRGARWSVPVTVMLALLAVTGVVAVAVAVRTASAAPGVPVPVRSSSISTAAPTPTAEVAPASPGTTAGGQGSAGAGVVVHVVGQVAAPGLVRLPAGARVDDALAAAGGPTGAADLSRVNLARPLVDGEQVVVPQPGEDLAAATTPAGPVGSGAAAPTAGPGQGGTPVNLNTATLADLDALPGIGPVLAQRILDWRERNGRFTSVDELGEVTGIGERVLERLRPLVQV